MILASWISLVGVPLIWTAVCREASAYNVEPRQHQQRFHGLRRRRQLVFSATLDFEYEAPDPGSRGDRYRTNLSSAYGNMPAGLRGEAVRSALRSGRCVGWSLHDTPLPHGLVRVQGEGCVEFLNNKLSNSFGAVTRSESSSEGNDDNNHRNIVFRHAALLTARGRMIDRIGVALDDRKNSDTTTAWMQTSPGHSVTELFQRLDPFVFPLDQVELQALEDRVFGFTLTSVLRKDVVQAFDTHIRQADTALQNMELPSGPDEALLVTNDDGSLRLLAVPSSHPPAWVGYTFWWGDVRQGQAVWQRLTTTDEAKGPVAIGALEYESLRIQAGIPAFDAEMTGLHEKDKGVKTATPATPLELHQAEDTIDSEKGCYMGQEGIASVLKNPRGPPRLLYQVVFHDESNLYESETQGEAVSGAPTENLTRLPEPGDALYVLGSNEEIQVGTLTSVAEPGSTGDPETLALALVRRSDSILQAMEKRELEIPRTYDVTEPEASSGMIQPPPMDPLVGLEVILEGSFTVGTLRSIPSRRYRPGQNMFVDEVPGFVSNLSSPEDRSVDVTRVPLAGGRATGDVYEPRSMQTPESEETVVAEWEREDDAVDTKTDSIDDKDDDDALEQARQEAEAAQAAAETAAVEAERKAAKMEMLRKRAQEAMARRKGKMNEE